MTESKHQKLQGLLLGELRVNMAVLPAAHWCAPSLREPWKKRWDHVNEHIRCKVVAKTLFRALGADGAARLSEDAARVPGAPRFSPAPGGGAAVQDWGLERLQGQASIVAPDGWLGQVAGP